jgi:hypothetical protein
MKITIQKKDDDNKSSKIKINKKFLTKIIKFTGLMSHKAMPYKILEQGKSQRTGPMFMVVFVVGAWSLWKESNNVLYSII